MDRKIEIMVPHFLLGFSLAYFVGKGSQEAVWALGISAILWLLSIIIPRVYPHEKPTELQMKIDFLEKKLEQDYGFVRKDQEELKGIVQANAEFSAKEFSTLKNVLQIKQMGR